MKCSQVLEGKHFLDLFLSSQANHKTGRRRPSATRRPDKQTKSRNRMRANVSWMNSCGKNCRYPSLDLKMWWDGMQCKGESLPKTASGELLVTTQICISWWWSQCFFVVFTCIQPEDCRRWIHFDELFFNRVAKKQHLETCWCVDMQGGLCSGASCEF